MVGLAVAMTGVGAALVAVAMPTAAAPAGRSAAVAPPPPTSFYATPFEKRPTPAALTDLGRVLFFDKSLSVSGRQSCASCHDPAHAWGPPNAWPVQMGGPALKSAGVRAVPSLTYQQSVPAFTEHFAETDGDDSVDQGPAGGRNWDGRALSAHDQASVPLLSPFEMGNVDSATVVARLRRSSNAPRVRDVFGDHVLDADASHEALAWNGLRLALEVFQQSPTEFYPYDSKYDAFLRRRTTLSASEARGLVLFNDTSKGNCAQCHPSAIKSGAFPQFTDYGFIALGVPRNAKISANADRRWVDLGLCGPLRTDLSDRDEYCGLFKTPSLRNVAVRQTFFHNGAMHSLKEVLAFYVNRDSTPAAFYPRDKTGAARRYDDLPARYHGNVNADAPFDPLPNGSPRLSDAEITDVIAFLGTLTDGWKPAAASAGPMPAQAASAAGSGSGRPSRSRSSPM
jgi:cytochrome c peroxidase